MTQVECKSTKRPVRNFEYVKKDIRVSLCAPAVPLVYVSIYSDPESPDGIFVVQVPVLAIEAVSRRVYHKETDRVPINKSHRSLMNAGFIDDGEEFEYGVVVMDSEYGPTGTASESALFGSSNLLVSEIMLADNAARIDGLRLLAKDKLAADRPNGPALQPGA